MSSKTLKPESSYVNPTGVAHLVLAKRMGERDPGNRPQSNDRIPYVFIVTNQKKPLQGDRIEHPDYVREQNIPIDYEYYITNQIQKPVQQIFDLVPNFNSQHLFMPILRKIRNQKNGQT